MLQNLEMAYLLTESPYLGKSIYIYFSRKFDEELKYAIGLVQ